MVVCPKWPADPFCKVHTCLIPVGVKKNPRKMFTGRRLALPPLEPWTCPPTHYLRGIKHIYSHCCIKEEMLILQQIAWQHTPLSSKGTAWWQSGAKRRGRPPSFASPCFSPRVNGSPRPSPAVLCSSLGRIQLTEPAASNAMRKNWIVLYSQLWESRCPGKGSAECDGQHRERGWAVGEKCG